jgi:hypothetical protein
MDGECEDLECRYQHPSTETLREMHARLATEEHKYAKEGTGNW